MAERKKSLKEIQKDAFVVATLCYLKELLGGKDEGIITFEDIKFIGERYIELLEDKTDDWEDRLVDMMTPETDYRS